MRFHERALNIQWKKGTKRPDKSNAIDMLCSGQVPNDELEKEDFEKNFDEVPRPFSPEERGEWLRKIGDVVVSSDAFVRFSWPICSLLGTNCSQFPFIDNVLRAGRSGVKYIAAPVGSQNDQMVFDTAEKLGITFIEQSIRLFHH